MTQRTLIDRLDAIPYTGAISDILDEMGFRNQVLPHEIQAIQPGQTVTGRALTLVGEPTTVDDKDRIFPPFLEMLGDLEPGEVLVSQPNDHVSAHLGELSAETAQFRGCRGAVIDGGVRDVGYVLRLGFPVFARYTTPMDILGRWRLADSRVPIRIGAVEIDPGDYILGDRDGVVIIPERVAEEVVTRAEEVVVTENHVRTAILDGVDPVEAFREYGRF